METILSSSITEVVPGIKRLRTPPALPSLITLIGYDQFGGWGGSNGTGVRNYEANIPGIQAGDLVLYQVSHGASGGSPGGLSTPPGFTHAASRSGDATALGWYWKFHTPGATLTYQFFNNVNYNPRIMALRGVDPVSPVISASVLQNFSAGNQYPTFTKPTGKASMLITSKMQSNNSSSVMATIPKPSNINDARTIYVPPHALFGAQAGAYVHNNTYYRILTEEEGNGGTLAPGVIGGDSYWQNIGAILLKAA